MSADNVKIVKVDPTGFYLNKEDSKQSVQSEASDISSISDSASEETTQSTENHDLVHLQSAPVNVSVIKEQPSPSPKQVQQTGGANNNENKKEVNKPVENYLAVKKPLEDDEESVNSQYSEKDINSEELPETNDTPPKIIPSNNSPTNTQTTETTTSRNDYYSDDEEEIIDMTDNKLYEVLASVFEDEEGDNVSENLAKLNRNMEKHNELLEKILGAFMEMNAAKHQERKFFETLALTVQNHSKLLKKNNTINEDIEVLENALDTELEPTNEDTDNKKGGRKTIKRMKQRIETPKIKKIH